MAKEAWAIRNPAAQAPTSTHGFDGKAALTLRRDVPNGVNPGEGVHLGAHPEAREQSRRIMLQALQQAFAR